jgi:hypothetical protein
LIGRTGAKFQFVSEQQLVDKDTVMQINSETNTIQVNRNRLNNFTTDEVVMSFIHELAHAQTLQALLNPITFEEKEFAKLIKEMYEKYWNKQVQKQLDETGTYDDDKARYGFTNEKEFVAEIYANKSFRDELTQANPELLRIGIGFLVSHFFLMVVEYISNLHMKRLMKKHINV